MTLGCTTWPDGLYQWGTGLCGVHRIHLPSITGKYGPGEKAYFPSNCGRKTKKNNFHNRAKCGNIATLMFSEPQWVRYLFASILANKISRVQ